SVLNSVVFLCLFVPYPATDVTCNCPRSRSGDVSGFRCRLVDVAHEVPCASGLDNPTCHRWNGEVAYNPNQHEDDIHRIGCVGDICRVGKHFNIPFQYKRLYFRKYGAEHIGYGQPQVHADISGQPLRKCGLKTIPYTYRKGYRPEYGQHDKKERPYGIYDQCRCLEKYLQKVAKPFLYGFFYLIGLSVKVHSRHGS